MNIIDALNAVPETRLRLIDLAWKAVREDGTLDPERAAFFGKELDEAIDEARGYIEATRGAVRCLRQIARS